MKRTVLVSGALALLSGAANAAEELCYAIADTALYADAGLSEEVRPIFQFDGAQFVPSAEDGETMFGVVYDVRMQRMLEESSYVRAGDWTCEVLAGVNSNGAAVAADELVYDVSQDACQQELSDTRVTFSASSIGFYESGCDIVGEEAGSDGSRILTLQCYGEGEEWSAMATVTPQKAGGIELKRDDYAQVYVSCD